MGSIGLTELIIVVAIGLTVLAVPVAVVIAAVLLMKKKPRELR